MQTFSKVLSETDINKRCAVPMKYFKMERFPKPKAGSNKMEFVVTDEGGRNWTLCCSTRNVGVDLNRPKHPKPVLINTWIQFVKSKKLRVGDRVIIYEDRDKTGSMHRRIKVNKRASPPEACRSPVKNQNLDGNKGSIRYNNDNEAPAIFQHLLSGVPNHDLSGNTAVKTSSIDKEQLPSHHGTSQHIACYETERPSQSLSLELTLKPTTTGGMTAATSSGIDKEQKPTFHSTSQDTACNNSETLSLSLSLGLTPNQPLQVQQHAYLQQREPKTIDFLGAFIELERKVGSQKTEEEAQ